METQRLSRISKTEWYADNVQSAQANAALFTEMQQDHNMAMENLVTVTQAGITLVVLLTKTISELSA